jgi:group I intron endonuclease
MNIIYCATNKLNGKVYIGKTSKSLEKRRKAHETLSNNKPKYYFHRALANEGIEVFEWTVLEEVESEYQLNEAEKYWINYKKSYISDFGYNLTLGGEGQTPNKETREKIRLATLGKNKGHKHSKESKKKIIEAHTGIKSPIRRKIMCIETKEIFDLMTEACHKYNMCPGSLTQCCQGKRKTVNNLHWKYINSEKDILDTSIAFTPKPLKKVRCIELNKIFNSAKEAADYLNIGYKHISSVCLGKRKTAEGYHWEHVKDKV